jgi:putative tricarboxylic transport membrane protein
MIESLTASLFGCLVGIVVGLLPGVNNTIGLILCYPYLTKIDPLSIIIFYSSMIQAAQFTGSVAALNWNILGEITSQPTIDERKNLDKFGVIGQALYQTSMASLIAVITSLVLSIGLIATFGHIKWLTRSEIQVAFAAVFLIICICNANNRWYINLLMISVGFFINLIGYDNATHNEFFTFGNPALYGGIPDSAVLVGLITIPLIVEIWKFSGINQRKNEAVVSKIPFQWISTLRGTVLGFAVGLIPYTGSAMCSALAHRIEKSLNGDDTPEHSIRRVAAAEAADNASEVSVLIPFLMYGLIMQTSEGLVFNLLQMKGHIITGINNQWFAIMAAWTIFACVIAHLFSGVFFKMVESLLVRYLKPILASLMICIIASISYTASTEHALGFNLICLAVFATISLALYRVVSFTPLLVGYIMQPVVWNKVTVIYELYF